MLYVLLSGTTRLLGIYMKLLLLLSTAAYDDIHETILGANSE